MKRFVLLLAMAVVALVKLGPDWNLQRVAGQTIPWPTFTRTATMVGALTATPTWTQRPTWTRVPTPTFVPTAPPSSPQPSATADSQAATMEPHPSDTVAPRQTLSPAETPTPALSIGTPDLTETISMITPVPGTTPEPSAVPIVFEVIVLPQVAGPLDRISYIVQVANVGHVAVERIEVVLRLPDDITLLEVDCAACSAVDANGEMRLMIGSLQSGQQCIVTAAARVVEDAWPGQTLRALLTLTADSQDPLTASVDLTLPWAPLPATGATRSSDAFDLSP
jgi:hypothetical protein